MSLPRLSPALLTDLPAEVQRPQYDRAQLKAGIVHLGLGNFARAFLVAQTEAALNAGDALDWGIAGYGLRRPDMHQALAPQQGLFTLAERDAAGQTLRVPGALLRAEHVGQSLQERHLLLAQVAHPDTRIVSLTITEKGYAGNDPGDALPTLLAGLALRQSAGLPGVTVLSLDNLSRNGEHTQARLLALSDGQAELQQWLRQACSFPSSMVDRIVPATTVADRARVSQVLGADDAWPVIAEPYLHWVLEDRFVAGRPAWPGVTYVPDAAAVAAWEAAKLRVVNGAHSALAYLGLAAGWQTVDVALAQPGVHRWLQGFLTQDVWPALGATAPPRRYGDEVLSRFANPALAHRTAQIAMDGSQKLPLRLLPTFAACLQAGRGGEHTALALAAWMQYQRGHNDAGLPHAVQDPDASQLAALAQQVLALPTAQAQAERWAGYSPVFGPLAGDARAMALLGRALQQLQTHGAAACLACWPAG